MFRFVARFARVRIEDSSFNRFALNGIQRDFFGGIFSGGIFVGEILSSYHDVYMIQGSGMKTPAGTALRLMELPFPAVSTYVHRDVPSTVKKIGIFTQIWCIRFTNLGEITLFVVKIPNKG